MSLIYWIGNTKTDAELVLPKHDILSRVILVAQSASNNEVEGPLSDISKARPPLVNPHRASPVHSRIHPVT